MAAIPPGTDPHRPAPAGPGTPVPSGPPARTDDPPDATARPVPPREAALRDRLMLVMPTLRHPTFRVLLGQCGPRTRTATLERTLRHMRQAGLVDVGSVTVGNRTATRYRLTQKGLGDRARLVLSARRAAG